MSTQQTKTDVLSIPLKAGSNYVAVAADGLKIVAQTYNGCDSDRYEARDYARLFASVSNMAKALASISAKARALSDDKSNSGAERGLWAGCADEADAALSLARGEA